VKITLRELTEDTVKEIFDTLIVNQDPVVIIYIDCEGGDPLLAFGLYSALTLSGKFIVTYAVSKVYSAAMIIFLAGHIRCAHEYSHFLIHEVSFEEDEARTMQAREYKRHAEELARDSNALFALIAKKSDIKVGTIRKKLKNAPDSDWTFYGEEAKTLKIADSLDVLPRDERDYLQFLKK